VFLFLKYNQVDGKGFAAHSSRRGKFEVMAGVLFYCRRAQAKTRIMYANNLSYGQLQDYLALLTSSGLLKKESEKYVTTSKGISFVEQFKDIRTLLSEENYREL
jgi:predicted transcriptional regulator